MTGTAKTELEVMEGGDLHPADLWLSHAALREILFGPWALDDSDFLNHTGFTRAQGEAALLRLAAVLSRAGDVGPEGLVQGPSEGRVQRASEESLAVVVRIDPFQTGDQALTLKEAFRTFEEADREVERLNRLRAREGMDTRYVTKPVRYFPSGRDVKEGY